MESGTEGDIVTVTLIVVLVTVTGTGEELLVIRILDTCTPAYLVELLFGATRCVCKRLEPTLSGSQVRIFLLAIFAIRLICVLGDTTRYQQLVCLQVEGQEVVLIQRNLVPGTDVHGSRDEVGGDAVIRHLTTEVLETETESEMALTGRNLYRLTIVERNVSGHGPCRVHLCTTAGTRVITVV